MPRWLIHWGQQGKLLVRAETGKEAISLGNEYLDENLPWCSVHTAELVGEAEAERLERVGIQKLYN